MTFRDHINAYRNEIGAGWWAGPVEWRRQTRTVQLPSTRWQPPRVFPPCWALSWRTRRTWAVIGTDTGTGRIRAACGRYRRTTA